MRVDVRNFAPNNAIDTCAIWNLLSSSRLALAARSKQLWFVVADYIRYEALDCPRTNPQPSELELQAKFRNLLEQSQGFSLQSVSLADLQAVVNHPAIKQLGKGEIAALALARAMRIGFMTDDKKARQKAESINSDRAHTTPQLLGWLIYEGVLSDGDYNTVIAEHEAAIPMGKGQLSKYFKTAYEEACCCRLMSNISSRQEAETD